MRLVLTISFQLQGSNLLKFCLYGIFKALINCNVIYPQRSHAAQYIAYMDSSKIAIFFVLVLGSTARVYPASQLGTVAPEP